MNQNVSNIATNSALEVRLWDTTVGYMSWNGERGRCAVFAYDPAFIEKGWNISPIQYSTKSPSALVPKRGDKDKLYHGLPPFVADSLPDRWGEKVMKTWMEKMQMRNKKMNPLMHLSYIGKRGMGALEYKPAYRSEEEATELDAVKLCQIADAIQHEREAFINQMSDTLLVEDLFKVSTSPGGKRAKAIIGMNAEGVIRSGQTTLPSDYKYYILKFNDDPSFPFSEVEMAYYQMACAVGIAMMPSRLIKIEGKNHFLTERFDRVNGEKVHVVSLAGMNPYMSDSYEGLFATCRSLHIGAKEQEDLYKRMVMNVLSGNVDDHSKNFSFLMGKDGVWHLAPAYDMVFSIQLSAPTYVNTHALSVNGKTDEITEEDLLYVGKMNDIKNAKQLVEEVKNAVKQWQIIADEAMVPRKWRERIGQCLAAKNNLLKNNN